MTGQLLATEVFTGRARVVAVAGQLQRQKEDQRKRVSHVSYCAGQGRDRVRHSPTAAQHSVVLYSQ